MTMKTRAKYKSASKAAVLCLALLALAAPGATAVDEVFTGRVTSVPDGDTLHILRDGLPVKVRIFGIDTPELGQPYGPRSRELAHALASGEVVIARVRDEDQYQRLVCEIAFADGRGLGNELLKAGLAWWYRKYAPKEGELRLLESAARKAKLGLWKQENPVPPWEWRRWPYCASVNSKVYHPCSCPSVTPNIIQPRNLIRFETEDDAKKSGRTHCKCGK